MTTQTDVELLREHADQCRRLAQRMTHRHSVHTLSRMADECNDLADGLALGLKKEAPLEG